MDIKGASSSSSSGSGSGAAAGPGSAPGSLMSLVDKKGSFALNTAGAYSAEDLLSRLHLRSDAGAQIIVHVPFIERVRVDSVLLSVPPAGGAPVLVKIFANRTAFDFADAEGEPTQAFVLTAASFDVELKLNKAKFAAVNALTFFFDGGEAADSIGLSQLRVSGTSSMRADVSKISKGCDC